MWQRECFSSHVSNYHRGGFPARPVFSCFPTIHLVRCYAVLGLFLLASGFLTVPGAAAAGPGIVGVRYFTAPHHTRVVLDLDGPASFEVRRIADPDRIAINVSGAVFSELGSIAVGDGLVRLIRRNPGSRRAQLVLDLDQRVEFRSFSLPADQFRPDRIVVDVLRSEGVGKVQRPRVDLPEPVSKPAIVLAPEPRPYRVIIDPGHGGLDPGASRKGIQEKDVVLDISKEMARLINALPGYRAELTRTGDYGLELWQRVDFARRKEGDLFISVHCNTHPRATVSGMEVYFLSLQGATDREARELADKENAAQLVGLDPGERPDDLVMDILMDLRMSQVLHQSASLSERLVLTAKRSGVVGGRKTKQAGFHVLKSLAMPSALVEVAYLSNSGDRKLLADRSNRRKIARVMVEGIVDWRRSQQDGLQLAVAPRREAPPARETGWTRRYKVQRGDNLWRLAQRHGTTVNEITDRNNLENRSILVGQLLKLPEVEPDP
jgi:N-acetylmuramoyl-L-alanine amidase